MGLSRAEAVARAADHEAGHASQGKPNDWLDRLGRALVCPSGHVGGLVPRPPERGLSAGEVTDQALAYRPIAREAGTRLRNQITRASAVVVPRQRHRAGERTAAGALHMIGGSVKFSAVAALPSTAPPSSRLACCPSTAKRVDRSRQPLLAPARPTCGLPACDGPVHGFGNVADGRTAPRLRGDETQRQEVRARRRCRRLRNGVADRGIAATGGWPTLSAPSSATERSGRSRRVRPTGVEGCRWRGIFHFLRAVDHIWRWIVWVARSLSLVFNDQLYVRLHSVHP